MARQLAGVAQSSDGGLGGRIVIVVPRPLFFVRLPEVCQQFLCDPAFAPAACRKRADDAGHEFLKLVEAVVAHDAIPRIVPMTATNCLNSPRASSRRRRPLAVRR